MLRGNLRAFILCAWFSWIMPSVLFAQGAAGTVWKRAFDHPVDWFLRTSNEFLIVRSGNSLSALEPSEGGVIWSIPDLEYEGSDTQGQNLLEVPDRSILLVNRVKLAKQPGLFLMGVDIQTGKILWQRTALDDFIEVRPTEANGSVLLITRKTDKLRKSARIAFHAMNYYVAGPYAFWPVFTKFDPATGQIDWSTQFPSTMTPMAVDFVFQDSVLCLNEYSELDHFRVACIDTQDGHQIWSRTTNTSSSYWVPPPIIYKGIVLQPSNCITAFDLKTGRLLWRSRSLGKVYDLVLEQGVALTAGEHGTAAFDPHTGQERWKLRTEGRVLNVAYWPEQAAIAFMDKRDLIVVRIEDGTVLRRTAHRFGANPRVILPVGEHFVVVLGEMNSVQYDLRTGEYVTSLPKADMAFPVSDFAIRSGDFRRPLLVGPRRIVHGEEFCRPSEKSTGASNPAQARNGSCRGDSQNQEFVFAAKGPSDSWVFWYFDLDRREFDKVKGNGLHPDASLKLKRIYLVRQNELASAPLN